MPAKNDDLHGNVPENSPVALVMVDVINDLEFEGGEELLESAIPMAENLSRLADRAREKGIAVIYVNDNFGKWRSDFRALLDHVLQDDVRGRPVAKLLEPKKSDYFVLKPKHSGFFATTLETLLEYLHARALIITGIATDRCVLFTASDAHMRDLHLYVPSDCCAAESVESHDMTLDLLRRTLDADTTPSTELDLDELQRVTKEGAGTTTASER
jgi:nicotinamidase-related amidase